VVFCSLNDGGVVLFPLLLVTAPIAGGLDLSFCGLTGTLLPELGNLPLLSVLVFHSNGLTGTIPEEYAKLTKLSKGRLVAPYRLGGVHVSLCCQLSIYQAYFDLSRNFLSGTMPEGLCSVVKVDCGVVCDCCGQCTL